MYNRKDSFDFAVKLKITPENFMPDFGTIYRATLLNVTYQGKLQTNFLGKLQKAPSMRPKASQRLKK